MPKTPTKRTYDDFDAAYAYFNKRLFGGRLPPCLITVRPHRGAYGYFSGERFGSRDGKEIHDEIALNIRHFEKRSPCEICRRWCTRWCTSSRRISARRRATATTTGMGRA